MKGVRKNNRKLIGSISIASAVVLVSVAFGPTILFSSPPEKETVSAFNLRDMWDIIVPDDFESIGQAINNAKSGDRIYVRSGIYKPGISFFDASLSIKTVGITIHGQDRSNTIINGRGRYNIVSIDADNTNFSGFTIRNNGVNGTLVEVSSNNNIISDNILEVDDYYDGTEYGMQLYNSNQNKIVDNVIHGGDRGIEMGMSNENVFEGNIIENNRIAVNLEDVFVIDFNLRLAKRDNYRICSGNEFIGNIVRDNNMGIFLDYSSDNLIFNNSFISNNKNGLILSMCENNKIYSNGFVDDGVDIWGSQESHFVHDIQNNLVNGKPLYYYYDKHSLTVPSDAGQVIIVASNDIDVENVKIYDTTIGVLIAFSSSIDIVDSHFENCSRGVFLFYSSIMRINRNNFIDNGKSASFICKGYFSTKSINWNRNYWGPRLFKSAPKKIVGRFHLDRKIRLFPSLKLGIRTRNFDKIPARSPY